MFDFIDYCAEGLNKATDKFPKTRNVVETVIAAFVVFGLIVFLWPFGLYNWLTGGNKC